MRFGKIVYKVSGQNGIARVRSEKNLNGNGSTYSVEFNNGAYGKNTEYRPVGRTYDSLDDAKASARSYAG